MQIATICDKYNFTSRRYLDKEISICSYDELQGMDAEERIYLITPFYQNEEEIYVELVQKKETNSIYKLSNILLEG